MVWMDVIRVVSRGAHQTYEGMRTKVAWVGEAFNRLGMLEPMRFSVFQFIEGFKAVATFPFTALKMPFYSNTQSLIGHTLKYNVLQYTLPLVIYYGVIRRLIEDESGEIAPYLVVVDLCANAIFVRAMVNAYAMNVFNNVNATTMRFPGSDEIKNLPSCECPDSKKLRATFMSPVYYAGKMIVPSLLSKIPIYGPIFEYTLKPLAIGENLAEVNLSELCTEDRVAYFSTHNMSSYGMGIGAMIALKTTTGIIYYFTGINGFFLEDGILCTLMPFMLFHMNTSRFPDEIRRGAAFETFYPIRKMVNAGVARASQSIIPRMQIADENGNVLEYLNRVWKSRPIRFTRDWVLDPKLHRDFQTLAELGPINLLVKENYRVIQEKLRLIDLVLQYPGTVENGLWLYNFLPFVPPKDHVAFIVSVLTKNTALTAKYLAFARRWLGYVREYDPRYPGGFKITKPIIPYQMLESYFNTSLMISPAEDQPDTDDFYLMEVSEENRASLSPQPTLRQRHLQRGHQRSRSDEDVRYHSSRLTPLNQFTTIESKPMPNRGLSPTTTSDEEEKEEWAMVPVGSTTASISTPLISASDPFGFPGLEHHQQIQNDSQAKQYNLQIIDNYLSRTKSENYSLRPT